VIAALLALLITLAAPPAQAVSSPVEMLTDPTLETRAEAIGHQLRCLVCQNESVEESEADLARDLRRVIRQRVSTGDSDQQVIDWMVARYGDFVRLRPPVRPATLVLWGSPLIALLAAAAAVWLARRRRPAPPAPLSEAEQTRLAKLLEP
jgi:cytochrome c-type biogenesis protein CcmH